MIHFFFLGGGGEGQYVLIVFQKKKFCIFIAFLKPLVLKHSAQKGLNR